MGVRERDELSELVEAVDKEVWLQFPSKDGQRRSISRQKSLVAGIRLWKHGLIFFYLAVETLRIMKKRSERIVRHASVGKLPPTVVALE